MRSLQALTHQQVAAEPTYPGGRCSHPEVNPPQNLSVGGVRQGGRDSERTERWHPPISLRIACRTIVSFYTSVRGGTLHDSERGGADRSMVEFQSLVPGIEFQVHRCRARRGNLKGCHHRDENAQIRARMLKSGSNQGENPALTGLCVLNCLDSGTGRGEPNGTGGASLEGNRPHPPDRQRSLGMVLP